MNGWKPITSTFHGELVYWSKPISDTLRLSVKGATWCLHRRELTTEYFIDGRTPRESFGVWWREREGVESTSAKAKRAAERALVEWREARESVRGSTAGE